MLIGMDLKKIIDDVNSLGTIKEVKYDLDGFDGITADRCWCVITDTEGHHVKILVASKGWEEVATKRYNLASVILNVVFHKLNLLPDSEIVGFTLDSNDAVHRVRKNVEEC